MAPETRAAPTYFPGARQLVCASGQSGEVRHSKTGLPASVLAHQLASARRTEVLRTPARRPRIRGHRSQTRGRVYRPDGTFSGGRIAVVVREAVELDADSAQRQRDVPQNDPILTAEEDVGGLDRPVHDSVRMQRRQRPEKLAEDLHDLIRGEDTARLQQLLECDSIHIVPYHKVDVPVGVSTDLSGQNQVVMNQLDRSPRQVQELGPDLRRVDQLRAEHPDHDVELAGFVARQVGRGVQPLAQGFLDLVRAVRLAEQLSDPLEIQGLLLPLQQKDRPVTLVALEQRSPAGRAR